MHAFSQLLSKNVVPLEHRETPVGSVGHRELVAHKICEIQLLYKSYFATEHKIPQK